MQDGRFPNALDAGTEIGGYVIRRVLGQGGFGITYEGASATGLAKLVAIKEFFPRGHASRVGTTVEVHSDIDRNAYEAVLKRFEAEGRKLIDVYDHPNIVRGENFIRARGSAFIIMEYVDGSTLHDWLKSRGRPSSEAELKPLLLQVLDAVDYLHELGEMHRDLSPKNVMIRERRRGRNVVEPVLIDFGATGEGLDIVRDGSTVVTANPGYAPPEQLHPQMHPQGRYTDIFALGGILYHAVTGRPPERPNDRLAATWKGGPAGDPYIPAAEAVADPSLYSPRFLAGIDRALSLDPSKRPQSVVELKRALGWSAVVPVDEAGAADEEDGADPLDDDRTRPLSGGAEDGDEATRVAPPPRDAPPPPPRLVSPPPPPAPPQIRRKPGRTLPFAAAAAVLLAIVLAFAPIEWGSIFGSSRPQTISPFTLIASIDPDGVTLDGFAPSETDRVRLVEVARRAAPGGRVTDRLQIADGAPSGFTDAVSQVMERLGDLSDGRISFRGLGGRIEGTARTPENYATTKAALTATLPGGATVSEAVRPAFVSPYRWSAETDLRTITLQGYVPDEATRQALADAARRAAPDRTVDDRTLIADGAPAGFAASAAAALGRIGEIAQGRVALSEGILRIEGTARSREAFSTARSFFALPLPGGVKAVADLQPPGPTGPYRLSVEVSERGLVLTGSVPDEQARRTLQAAARAAIGTAGSVEDRTTVADDAPAGFANASRFALDLAARLKSGRVDIVDSVLNVEGTPRNAEDQRAIKTALAGRIPSGFRLGRDGLADAPRDAPPAPTVTTVAAATECDRLALPPDYSEKPPGVVGVAFGDIDADAALRACEQAVAEFPSVRRLQLAYGQALARKRRYAEARTAYQKAADAGDGRGFGYLGWLNRDGLGVSADRARAAEQFERGAALNDHFSIHEIAVAYFDGLGRPKDQVKALELFRRGATLGNVASTHYLGWYYQNGFGGLTVDYERAFEFFKRAADKGNPASLNQIGYFYQKGLGRPVNLAEGLRWYERAAEAGSDVGAWNAALAYDKGQGVAADGDKAARYFLLAYRRNYDGARKAVNGFLDEWEIATIKGIQRILRDAGHYRGFIDGEFTPQVRAAIEAYGRPRA